MLFKVCHFLYLHTSGEPLLPAERQPLVPSNTCLAHIVLQQLPGRGMHRQRTEHITPHWVHAQPWIYCSLLHIRQIPNVSGCCESYRASGCNCPQRSWLLRTLRCLSIFSVWDFTAGEIMFFFHSHLTATGAILVSVPRRKVSPSQVPAAGCSQQNLLVLDLP